jgi:accessory colonization factor AcfC
VNEGSNGSRKGMKEEGTGRKDRKKIVVKIRENMRNYKL